MSDGAVLQMILAGWTVSETRTAQPDHRPSPVRFAITYLPALWVCRPALNQLFVAREECHHQASLPCSAHPQKVELTPPEIAGARQGAHLNAVPDSGHLAPAEPVPGVLPD